MLAQRSVFMTGDLREAERGPLAQTGMPILVRLLRVEDALDAVGRVSETEVRAPGARWGPYTSTL